ncbi:carbohydrate ABC transporter permease [Blautia sp. HCP3S3_G3]|uniref:carbohydrate ABC transporter permease n=1 Tax=Blautia sp. HCP3S3_G3 TaxID=3438913 RepID=UPI003F8AC3AA
MKGEKKRKEKVMNRVSAKWNIIFSILLIFCAMMVILPMALMVVVSFSSSESIKKAGYTFLPQEWSLEGYRYLLEMGDQILRSYRITIIYSVVGTVLGLLIMMMFAYVISQRNFRYSRFLTWMLFFTMLFSGGLVPSYILNVRYYHLKDTVWILILPGLVSAYMVIILRTFIRTAIPDGLFDAAKIDGAGHFTIFFKIVVPLSKAGIATVALFTFIAKWNDWFIGMLYVDNPNLVPLQTLLTKLQSSIDFLKQNTQAASGPDGLRLLKSLPSTNLRMACTVIAVVPVLFAYPFFQRYFVNGMTVGSIKE